MFKKFDSTWLTALLAVVYLYQKMKERFPDLRDADTAPWWGTICIVVVFAILYFCNPGKSWHKPGIAKLFKLGMLFLTWGQLTRWLVAINCTMVVAVVIAGAITMLLAVFSFNNREGK